MTKQKKPAIAAKALHDQPNDLVERAKSASIIDVVSARIALKPDGKEFKGQCPFHAEKTPSFHVVPEKHFYHCFGCGAHGDAIKFVMECDKVDFIEACYRITGSTARLIKRPTLEVTKVEDDAEKARKIAAAHEIWKETKPAHGTLVETYLTSRGITLSPPAALRFHPTLFHKPTGKTLPAMVAGVQDNEGKFAGIHRTYLRDDGGGKATVSPNKMGLGCWMGKHIQLAPAGATLAIAEGIETALSVMQVLPLLPTWACMALGNIGATVPSGVHEVVICADADGKDKDRAAHDALLAKAAAGLQAAGKVVRMVRPPAGMDFNDWLRELKGIPAA